MNDTGTSPPEEAVWLFEQRGLRKWWWLFPLLGALAAVLISRFFWPLVDLSGWPSFSMEKITPNKYFLPAGVMALLPFIWWCGLKWNIYTRPFGGRVPWALILAGILVLGADRVMQHPRVQSPFWLAVRARTGPEDYFMRELSYIRLETADKALAETSHAVVLLGSSQVLNGIDAHRLSDMIAPVKLKRRAMYGMTPLKALGAQYYLSIMPSNTVVWYLSEFDFTNQDPLPADWLRPLIRINGLQALVKCYTGRQHIQYWRQWVDMGMSAMFEAWRCRDYARHILMHMTGVDAALAGDYSAADKTALQNMASAYDVLKVMPTEQEAFALLMEYIRGRDAKTVIFEGRLHPDMYTSQRNAVNTHISHWMQAKSMEWNFVFVPLEKQPFRFPKNAWKDMTHLNARGRETFTAFVGEYLTDTHLYNTRM